MSKNANNSFEAEYTQPEEPRHSAMPAQTHLTTVRSSATSRRLIELDFIRGIAILFVLGHHIVTPLPKQGLIKIPATLWYRIGWTGVDLFFVLSGFLVGGLLM